MAIKEHKYELGQQVYIDGLKTHGRVCVVRFGENDKVPTYEVNIFDRYDGPKIFCCPEWYLSDPIPESEEARHD